jgi:hypothetical protein
MILTEEQRAWCAEHNLGVGFDDDNPALVQFCHVCETTGEEPCTDDLAHMRSITQTICCSPRLWFGEGKGYIWSPRDSVTCEQCIRILVERGCP